MLQWVTSISIFEIGTPCAGRMAESQDEALKAQEEMWIRRIKASSALVLDEYIMFVLSPIQVPLLLLHPTVHVSFRRPNPQSYPAPQQCPNTRISRPESFRPITMWFFGSSEYTDQCVTFGVGGGGNRCLPHIPLLVDEEDVAK